MDLNDFTNAENKKMTAENDIPKFTPPTGDAPKAGVDGKSKKAPTFTPPTTSNMDPGCYYHPEERVVGHCARCGKNLCHYCYDSFGVAGGEYAGKVLCYDCTKKLVSDNVQQLTENLNTIKFQFTLSIIGIVIGFIMGFSEGISDGFGTALWAGIIFGCVGGVFLSALKVFLADIWEAIKMCFSGSDGWVSALIYLIVRVFIIAIQCIFQTITNTVKYITYIKRTSGIIEQDSSALQAIEDRMTYSRVMNENRGMSLADLMNEGSELYNNSYARMVQEQGEEKAEAFVSGCTTRIAENGEIIRSFAA